MFDIEQPSILEIFSDGGSLELTGEASSLSLVYYQWEISSDDRNLMTQPLMVQTTTLSMSNISKYDNYLFRLKASTPGLPVVMIFIQESRIQLEQLFIPEGLPDGNGVDTWHISGIEDIQIIK